MIGMKTIRDLMTAYLNYVIMSGEHVDDRKFPQLVDDAHVIFHLVKSGLEEEEEEITSEKDFEKIWTAYTGIEGKNLSLLFFLKSQLFKLNPLRRRVCRLEVSPFVDHVRVFIDYGSFYDVRSEEGGLVIREGVYEADVE